MAIIINHTIEGLDSIVVSWLIYLLIRDSTCPIPVYIHTPGETSPPVVAFHICRPSHPGNIRTFDARLSITAQTHTVCRYIDNPHAHIKLGQEAIATALSPHLHRRDVVARPIKAMSQSIRVVDRELSLQRILDTGTLAEGDHDGAGLIIAAFGILAVLFKFADLYVRTAVGKTCQ